MTYQIEGGVLVCGGVENPNGIVLSDVDQFVVDHQKLDLPFEAA